MTVQELYITSAHKLFSTFLDGVAAPQDTKKQAELLFLSLLERLSKKSNFSISLEHIENISQEINVSKDSSALLTQFIQKYSLSQTEILLTTYLLALNDSDCSPATIKNYRSDINQFLHFTNYSHLSQTLTKQKVLEFIRAQRELQLSGATIKRKLVSLAQFGLWLESTGAAPANSYSWLVALSHAAPEPSPVTEIVTQNTQKRLRLSLMGIAHGLGTKLGEHSTKKSQEHSEQIKQNLRSIQAVLQKKSNSFISRYANLAMMVLFLVSFVYFGYQQFIVSPEKPLAFPTTLTRPTRTLSFQGRLTDTAQNPVTSATNFRFKLYDSGPSTAGGTQLWDSGTCSVTPDQDGIFATGLGSDCGSEIDSSVFSENANVWLQVQVGAEILSPRQSIKSVAYALNSETLQGFPPADPATANTVVVMNNSGEVVLGGATPKLKASSTSLTLEGTTLNLQTTSGSNGNIVLDPDGLGQIIAKDYIAAPGATLSATYAGGTALTLNAGPSATADIMKWQTSAGGGLGVITASGNIGIGTTSTRATLDVAGDASTSGSLVFRTGTSSIDVINGQRLDFNTSPGGDVGLAAKMTILNNGNVGIGTTNPGYSLEVTGNGTGYFAGQLTTNSWLSTKYGLFSTATNPSIQIDANNSGAGTLTLGKSGDGDTLIIEGSVGIGTTVPSQSLHIENSMRLTGGFYDGVNSPGSNGYILKSTGSATQWVDGNSLFDIGWWDNTANALHPRAEYAGVADLILGSNATASAKFAVMNINSGTPTATMSGNFAIASPLGNNPANTITSFDGGTLDLRTSAGGDAGATSRIFIANNGLVGIGTTAPSQLLDVNGDLRVRGNNITDSADATRITLGATTTLTNTTTTLSGTTTLTASSLATFTTSSALALGGATSLTFTADNATIYGSDVADGDITIHGTSNATRTTSYVLLQPTAGNVGIGTTTPGAVLDVNGVSRFRSRVQVTGNALPTTGAGLELGYDGSAESALTSYDRDGAAYKSLRFNALSYTWQTSGADKVELDANGNFGIGTSSPSSFKLQVTGSVGPTTTATYDLGSNSLRWNNIYGTTIYQGANQVCDSSGNCSNAGLWQNNLQAFHPRNEYAQVADLLVGSTATASADFRVTGLGNGTTDLAGYTYGRRFIDIDSTGYYVEPGNATTAGLFAGNVGIGTTTASQQLTITGSLLANDAASRIAAGSAGYLSRVGIYSTPTFTDSSTAVYGVNSAATVNNSNTSYNGYYESLTIGVGATINAAYGMHVTNPAGSGTLTDNYGVYVDSLTKGSTNYAVYTAGSTPSYFGGNLGVGTTTINSRIELPDHVAATGGIGIGSDVDLYRSAADILSIGSGDSLAVGGTTVITSTRFVQTANGTAGGPSHTFSGDATSGMFLPSAGNLGLSSNGGERIRIDNAGNVGINTTNPSSFKLQVTGSVGPTTTATYDLGSNSLRWNNIYGTTIYQGANQVCDTSGNCTTSGLWERTNNVYHPRNEWGSVVDIVVGGTSTASADFRVTGLGNGTTDLAGYTYGRRFIDIDSTGYYVEPGNATTAGLFAGNVGIGTTSPDTDFEIVNGSQAITANNIRYYRNVAHYSPGVSSETGTMKITLPKSWSNTMMHVRIQGYNYTAAGAWEVIVSGYNWSGTPAWVNATAEIRGTAPFTQVRLAHDGANNVILLGNTASTWSYPKITVTEFIAGHSNLTGWGSGWTIAPDTLETGIANVVTPAINSYMTTAGNFGIGTTAPSQVLDVNGDLRVRGNNITDSADATRITLGATTTLTNTTTTLSGTATLTAASLATFTTAAALDMSSTTSLTLGDNANFYGSNVANGDISIHGTSDPTRTTSYVLLQPTAGNVGIGTTVPTQILDVNGDLRVRGNNITDSADATRITLGATTTLTNTTTTLSGTTTLTAASLATLTTAASLNMSSTTGLTLGDNATINGSDIANGDLTLQGTSDATRTTSYVLLQPTAGSVGIGNSAPTQALHITGGLRVTGGFYDSANSPGSSGYILTSTGGPGTSWLNPESLLDTGWWDNTLNVLHPRNEYGSVADLTIGGTSTASAEFRVTGNGNGGTNLPGYVYAKRYLDIDDTNYYVEPGNTGTAGAFAGNVGIGATGPNAKLQVVSAGKQINVDADGSGTNYSGYPLTLNRSGSSADGSLLHGAYNSNGSYYYGQTHASFGARGIDFSYAGGIKFYASGVATTADGSFTPTEVMRIANSGNVSIGTTSDLAKFYIRDADNNATADIAQFFAQNLTQGIGIGYNRIEAVGSNANQDIQLMPKGTGSVGIGVTPTQMLDVNGDLRVRGNDITDSADATRITLGATTTLTNTTTTLSGTTTLTASSLATFTTSSALALGGATSLTFTADNATINGSDVADGDLTLQGTSNATRTTSYVLLQPTAGNVGIGTTAPEAKLDVAGDFTRGTMRYITVTRTLSNTAGSWVDIGSFANNGVGNFAKVTIYTHSSAIIQMASYSFAHDAYSSGSSATWIELPPDGPNSLYSDTQNIAVDAYNADRNSTSSPIQLRLRTKNAFGSAANVTIVIETNSAFTGSTTSGTGATAAAGYLGSKQWMFPASTGPWNATTDGLYIQSNGNVGIGTTTPSSFKLEIAGSIGPTVTDTYDLGSATKIWNDVYTDRICFDGGSDCITNSNAMSGYWQLVSNVLSPDDALNDLAIGGSTVAASMFGIDESAGNFYLGYDNSANPTLNFEATDADAGEFGFNTNDSFFFSNANVGIGTTNPGYKLQVNGDIGTNYNSIVLNPSGGTVATDGTYGIYWHNTAGAPNTSYGIYRTAGAWTASTYQQMRIQFDTGIQLGAGTGVGTGYDKSYVEVVNGKGLMVSSGNVGIGTTAPTAKLHVNVGDIFLSSNTNYNSAEARYGGNISLLTNLKGRQVNDNPDFMEGTSGYNVYDNGASGSITLSIVADSTAPSSSGRVMRLTHTAAGSPSPYWGGFYKATQLCAGSAVGHCIRRGNRHVVRIWAKMPAGTSISFHSNSMGTGGNFQWISSVAGTGNWEEYIGVETMGAGASSTNFFAIVGGSRPLTWDVASMEIIDIDAPADVDRATALNVGYKNDITLGTGQLLSTDATYLAVDGGNVGIGNKNPGYTLQVGQATASVDTAYGINVSRNGTSGSPGTYDATSALYLLDWAADGPGSIDGVGLLGVGAGRIADGDTNAANASLLRIANDNGAAMRVDGKRNTYIGYSTDTTSTQVGSLFVSGNLGVGTTAPGAKLAVMGGNMFIDGSAGYDIYDWSATDANWRIGMNNSNAEVGFTRNIATSHVQYATFASGAGQGFAVGDNVSGLSSFEVTGSGSGYLAFFRGSVTLDGQGGQLRFRKTNLTDSADDLGIWAADTSNTFYIADWSTGTKGLTINTSSGNVGIGTTNAGVKLAVNGAVNMSTLLHITGVSTGAYGISADDGFGSEIFNITRQAGNVLDINSYGPIGFVSNVAGADGTISTAYQMYITNGNVGIGMASPSEKLEVAGSYKLNGPGGFGHILERSALIGPSTNEGTTGSRWIEVGEVTVNGAWSGESGFTMELYPRTAYVDGRQEITMSVRNSDVDLINPRISMTTDAGQQEYLIKDAVAVRKTGSAGTTNTVAFWLQLSANWAVSGAQPAKVAYFGTWAVGPNLTPQPSYASIQDTGTQYGVDAPGFAVGKVDAIYSMLQATRTNSEEINGFAVRNLQPGGWGSALRVFSKQNFSSNTELEAGRIQINGESNWTSAALTDSFMHFDLINDGTLAEKVRITSLGSVGIGTAPSISLAVGDSDSGLHSTGDGQINLYSNSVNTLSARSGAVGIGTTSMTYALEVMGSIRARNSGTANIYLESTGASGRKYAWETRADGNTHFADLTANTQRITVLSGGNVGISQTSPGAKLTASGNIRNDIPSQGWIELSGDLTGYSNNVYPTLKTNGRCLYFDAEGSYTGYICGTSGFVDVSDESLKTNVVKIDNALEKILKLDGVYYAWKDGRDNYDNHIGVIAQEVEKIVPEIVNTSNTGIKGVFYGGIASLSIGAIKEQQAQIVAISQSLGDVTLTQSGILLINGSDGTYDVAEAVTGSSLQNVIAGAKGFFANLRAGLMTAQELVVERSATIAELSVNSLQVGTQSLRSYIESVVQNMQLSGLMNTFTPLPPGSVIDSVVVNDLVATGSAIISQNASVGDSLLVGGNASVSGSLAVTGTSQLGALIADSATISGELVVQDLVVTGSTRLALIEAQQAQLENVKATTAELFDATVSGTLYAENIADLDAKIASAIQQPSFIDLLTGNEPAPPPAANPISIYDPVIAAGYTPINPSFFAENEGISLASGDVILDSSALFIRKYLEVNGVAYVTQALGIGESLTVGAGTTITDGIIAYTGTTPESTILQIQPSGQGRIELLAGLLKLENGVATINGDLTIAGKTTTQTLLTNLIQPADFGNPFQVQVAGVSTESGEVRKSRFEIINELGTPVATISAEGKANFAGGIGVGSESLTVTSTATSSSVTTVAQKTSGRVTIPAGTTEVIIESDNITDSSLIYVTPVGSTQNQVLYVKSQTAENTQTPEKEGRFVVGFDAAVSADINFNWWIVN